MVQAVGVGAPADEQAPSPRLEWLDGVRALAATFVVLHHAWLMSYGGYPGNNGPWYTDWLVYGHMAVSVFIVVSGFSLMLAPQRNGHTFPDGVTGFLRRRFWRIVPPYWIALLLSSVLVMSGFIGSPSGQPVQARDVLVHLFLVQDAVGSVAPNGVFWSIAVEWHIYFLFPVVLWCYRRFGVLPTVAIEAAAVIVVHVAGAHVPLLGALDRFSPAYLILFTLGTAATARTRGRAATTAALVTAAGLGAVLAVFAAFLGSERIVAGYFWVDLLAGAATAALFLALSRGRARFLRRALAARWLVAVGRWAFSLYLVHALVLETLRRHLVPLLRLDDTATFWTLLGLGLPASLLVAHVFFRLFERPFLRIRSWEQLASALSAALRRSPFPAPWRLPWSTRRHRAVRTLPKETR